MNVSSAAPPPDPPIQGRGSSILFVIDMNQSHACKQGHGAGQNAWGELTDCLFRRIRKLEAYAAARNQRPLAQKAPNRSSWQEAVTGV
jgi:hypothetical protein